MYLPDAFRESSLERIHSLIEANSFGILVSHVDGGMFATHLPFLLDRGRGEHGTLRGHMARANPQWQAFAGSPEALVIFQGPHAYISPSWYQTAPSVPTWNYVAVHVYGRATVIDDADELRRLLQDLVDRHEKPLPEPWIMSSLSTGYLSGMMRGIVGFEIAITRLEGKQKLSQNRSIDDRQGAAAGLEALEDAPSLQVARLMRG